MTAPAEQAPNQGQALASSSDDPTAERSVEISRAVWNDLVALLDQHVAEGVGFERFSQELMLFLSQHHWSWFGTSNLEHRQRALVLYKAYCSHQYAKGRTAQLGEADWPLWVFHSHQDCPESHRRFDGLVVPPTDPFWSTHKPPLDWDCGCCVLGARSERGARRLGGDPEKIVPHDSLACDIRGDIWRDEKGPNLLQMLEAIVDGRTRARA